MRLGGHDWLIAIEKKVINISMGGSVFLSGIGPSQGYDLLCLPQTIKGCDLLHLWNDDAVASGARALVP